MCTALTGFPSVSAYQGQKQKAEWGGAGGSGRGLSAVKVPSDSMFKDSVSLSMFLGVLCACGKSWWRVAKQEECHMCNNEPINHGWEGNLQKKVFLWIYMIIGNWRDLWGFEILLGGRRKVKKVWGFLLALVCCILRPKKSIKRWDDKVEACPATLYWKVCILQGKKGKCR